MEDKACVFCNIVAGTIAAEKVYEDRQMIAILDIGPVAKGHTLVIPKDHHVTFLDMPAAVAKEFSHVTKVVGNAVMKATGAEGINISMNIQPAAGQSVMHAHFHVIPRFHGDGLRLWPQGTYAAGEAEKVAGKIRRAMPQQSL